MYASLWKSKLSKWWNEKKVALEDEYTLKEANLIIEIVRKERDIKDRLEMLERSKRDIEDQEKRINDRRAELERVNQELKEQIRIIEAKSSPSNIWETSFSQGFSKAWDMMIPLMKEGLDKVKEKIREEEIEASFPRIDLVVEQRLKEIGSRNLIETHQLEAKKRDFELKLSKAEPSEKAKYENYISLLNWVLGNRNGN